MTTPRDRVDVLTAAGELLGCGVLAGMALVNAVFGIWSVALVAVGGSAALGYFAYDIWTRPHDPATPPPADRAGHDDTRQP